MNLPLKERVPILVAIIMLTPYQYLPFISLSSLDSLTAVLITAVQLLSITYTALAAYQAKTKQLTSFWQFLLLAALTSTLPKSILLNTHLTYSSLIADFTYLFSYFFIILAIESNPHSPVDITRKNVDTRAPSIFFTLLCFCYLILLPYEFDKPNYQSLLPSLLFHLSMASVIFLRVLLNVIKCQNLYWKKTYTILSLGCAALIMESISSYFSYNANTPSFKYSQQVLQTLPYLSLILISTIAIKRVHLPIEPASKTSTELYLFGLSLFIIVLHLVGKECSLAYISTSYNQSLLVIGWFIITMIFIAILVHKKQNTLAHVLNESKALSEQKSALLSLNEELTKSLLYSEDKAIVSASNNAILTTTTQGMILSANPAASKAFQCLEHEIINTNVSKLFSTEDKMHYFFNFKSNVYALQRKESGISIECTAKRSDNSEFPVQAELQWAERQEQPLIVITFINLTARKLAEKQTLELKDKFIANISHEFRTPLTIINGVLDKYILDAKSANENLELTTAKRNGLRLVRMVEQLLELSKLSNKPNLTLATYKLDTLMAMPSDSFKRLAQQSQLTFKLSIAQGLWLECDAQAFEKIIFNLLANAIKYTPAGGEVEVNAYCEQDTIYLDIIDTGIGINKESQDKIFERFQRATDEKNHAIFGVGIGLSLVNELVNAHQWRISVVSEYNQGSKFTLAIPMAQPAKSEASVPISISENEVSSLLLEQQSQASTHKPHSGHVVLVIEDNSDMQNHIKQIIEKKHHCLLADSGELGIDLAREYLPDLIVCDIMLTGIDGFSVLKALKQEELTEHIPVILLTARSDLDSRLQGLNLHADDYLSKPFNHQELLARIDNLMENRANLQQSLLHKLEKKQQQERKDICHQNAAKQTAVESDTMNEKFLTKLENVLAKLYTEQDLGIHHIASEMAMSERQLQRKLKVILGISPNNFIKEFRLRKAQELLRSGAQIGRIALDVGFSSQTYFGRCFKESFDCTPKQYQQQILKQEEQ